MNSTAQLIPGGFVSVGSERKRIVLRRRVVCQRDLVHPSTGIVTEVPVDRSDRLCYRMSVPLLHRNHHAMLTTFGGLRRYGNRADYSVRYCSGQGTFEPCRTSQMSTVPDLPEASHPRTHSYGPGVLKRPLGYRCCALLYTIAQGPGHDPRDLILAKARESRGPTHHTAVECGVDGMRFKGPAHPRTPLHQRGTGNDRLAVLQTEARNTRRHNRPELGGGQMAPRLARSAFRKHCRNQVLGIDDDLGILALRGVAKQSILKPFAIQRLQFLIPRTATVNPPSGIICSFARRNDN
jgi:hypothetical protein